jgi:hypothetical protein
MGAIPKQSSLEEASVSTHPLHKQSDFSVAKKGLGSYLT